MRVKRSLLSRLEDLEKSTLSQQRYFFGEMPANLFLTKMIFVIIGKIRFAPIAKKTISIEHQRKCFVFNGSNDCQNFNFTPKAIKGLAEIKN